MIPDLRRVAQTSLPRRTTQGFGWLPDLPDKRDHIFNPHTAALRRGAPKLRVPSRVDLRKSNYLPPVVDQLSLGACTSNAIAVAVAYEQAREALAPLFPSRLFIYYYERAMINMISQDSGAYIRDGFKVISKLGCPPESSWPYDISRFTKEPPPQTLVEAEAHQALAYARVLTDNSRTQTHVKQALASLTPVVFGFTVYDSFYDIGSDGVMRTPDTDHEQVWGGHALAMVGYETLSWQVARSRRVYAIAQGSWGPSSGEAGFYYMPLTWLCDPGFADDFWAIQDMEG